MIICDLHYFFDWFCSICFTIDWISVVPHVNFLFYCFNRWILNTIFIVWYWNSILIELSRNVPRKFPRSPWVSNHSFKTVALNIIDIDNYSTPPSESFSTVLDLEKK